MQCCGCDFSAVVQAMSIESSIRILFMLHDVSWCFMMFHVSCKNGWRLDGVWMAFGGRSNSWKFHLVEFPSARRGRPSLPSSKKHLISGIPLPAARTSTKHTRIPAMAAEPQQCHDCGKRVSKCRQSRMKMYRICRSYFLLQLTREKPVNVTDII